MWHSMPRANEETLQALTDKFNSSQSDVKVNAREPGRLRGRRSRSTRPVSRSGDLPDVVQLQETDQQQMIDTQTVLPASVCAKADKYSFSDFLPRVISYFTVQGTQYAMPFNTSGPVLYYNKKAFTAAGLDPEQAADDARRGARRGREAQEPTGVPSAARAQDRPDLLRAVDRDGEQALREQQQRAQGARDEGGVRRRRPVAQIFTLDGRHGEGRPRRDQPRHRHQPVRRPARASAAASHAMAIDTSASLGTINAVLGAGSDPEHRARRRRRCPGPSRRPGGVFVQGGELFMVNKSAPAKQAAAWQFLKFLDEPENMTTWAIGTGYIPIRKIVGREHRDAGLLGGRTRGSRSPTTSCSAGADTTADRGIGDRRPTRACATPCATRRTACSSSGTSTRRTR